VTYLIDTNIISEVRKGERANAHVAAWYAAIPDESLYLSVLVLGEIRRGIERKRPKDVAQSSVLEKWLEDVDRAFGERILPISRLVAEEWGRMGSIRPLSVVDGLMAATAKVHRLTLVTRNVSDVQGLGAQILNPFEPGQR
jgi:toxin FitB